MGQDNTSFWVEIKKFEETLAKDPTSYCFAPLAELYRKLKLYDDAINVAKKGCEIHPEYVGGYLTLGRTYFDKGMKPESREALERVVRVTPDNLMAQKMLSHLYVDADDTAAAERTLQIILSLYPDDSESRIMLDSMSRPSAGPPIISVPDDAPVSEALAIVEEVDTDGPACETFLLDDVDVIEELEPLEDDIEDEDIPAVLFADEVETEQTGILVESYTPESFVGMEVVESSGNDQDLASTELDSEVLVSEPEEFTIEIESDVVETAIPVAVESKQDLSFPEPVVKPELPGYPETAPVAAGFEPSVVEAELGGSEAFSFADDDVTSSEPEEPLLPQDELRYGANGFPVVGKDPMSTVTLAELYIQQGLLKRALKIYRDLVEASPDDDDLKQRLIQLKHSIDTDESIARDHALDSNYKVAATEEGNVASIHAGSGIAKGIAAATPTAGILATLEGWLANIERRR